MAKETDASLWDDAVMTGLRRFALFWSIVPCRFWQARGQTYDERRSRRWQARGSCRGALSTRMERLAATG
jgi:hypothetical protein